MCTGKEKEETSTDIRECKGAETTTANAAKHAAKCMINVFGPE